MSEKQKFKIGDHVTTYDQGLDYFGYVLAVREYQDGGWEYQVDFYSYIQGKTWVVEWKLEEAPVQKTKGVS